MNVMQTGYKSGEGSSAYTSLVESAVKCACISFGISQALLLSSNTDISEELMDNFINFAVKPLVNCVTLAFLGSLVSPLHYKKGYNIAANFDNIYLLTIYREAEKADKLIAASLMTVNEVRADFGKVRINSEFADRLIMTKNYGYAEDVVKTEEIIKVEKE